MSAEIEKLEESIRRMQLVQRSASETAEEIAEETEFNIPEDEA